jgi:serine/threonine-protein kinase
MLGTQLLHYKVLKKLGEGGMGEVYLAQDLNLGRQVAIKVLSSERVADPQSRHRFLHEAKAQAMLSHPNIATFYEVLEHENCACIVMEYVDGQPLSELIKTEKLTVGEALDVAIQIGEGLQAAHEHEVMHRDIKPDNVMITSDGRVKIMDFGLARWKGATTITQQGTRLGSAYYMSPEQAEGRRVDYRTDVFSLGVILYELLCKQRPFEGENETLVVYDLINSDPQPVARYCRGVPEFVEWIVMKCLAKAPEERYQSAADLVADLNRARHELHPERSGSHATLFSRVLGRRRHVRRQLGIAAIVIVAAAVAIIPASRRSVLRVFGAKPAISEMQLVVIPLSGLGENPPSSAVLDGLQETLTSKLTQMEPFHHSLRIVPASDVRRVGVTSVREARKAFGATHCITGSMQGLRDRVRVTMNLVDARSEIQLRSSVIDDSSASASSLQDSTVVQLAALLDIHLPPDRRLSLSAGQTTVSRAYDFYLEGRGHYQRATKGIGMFARVDIAQLDSAILSFQKALGEDSRYARAYAALGEAYWRKFRTSYDSTWLEPAIGNALRAMEIDDHVVPSYITLGLIHQGTGRYIEALYDYKQAIKIDSFNVEAYRGMARAYAALGRLGEAESVYKAVIDLKPDYISGYYDLELFYLDAGRYDDARALVRTVTDLEPEGYDSWNKVGNMYGAVYYGLGEWDKAREIWERSLTFGPSYAAYSNLGTIEYNESHYIDAAKMYESALYIYDRDYRVWINLASAYERIPGKHEQVQATYRRAIDMAETERMLNPRDPSVLVHLAECYAIVRDSARAFTLAGQALGLAPDNMDVIVRAGIVHEKLGGRDSALSLIGKALELGYPKGQIAAQPDLEDLLADPRLVETHARKNR